MTTQARALDVRPWQEALPASIDLGVVLRTNSVGGVEMDAAPEHHLLLHVGPPARGFWQSHDVFYTAGDIDFVPAGVRESWEQLDAATVVDISLACSFVRRAADDIGLDAGADEPNCQFRDPQIEHIARAFDAERRARLPERARLRREPRPCPRGTAVEPRTITCGSRWRPLGRATAQGD